MTLIPDDAVGVSEAARVLGISARHVQRLVDGGQLRALRTQIGRLIDPADVQRLARERAERR